MSTQHFFLGNRHLGSREIETTRIIQGLEVKPHDSYVYFCGRCGDIWARFLHDKARYTQCFHFPCAKHGDGHLSMLHDRADYDPLYFEENWPPAAVQYEFERFLAHAIKELT